MTNDDLSTSKRFIEIHQCLFGYRDGHRLLAASRNLPQDVTSTLLVLSDQGPGLDLESDDGCWTGVPLPSAKAYALIRAWNAPEMRRPGCVWAHALIIDFRDMARITEFSSLRSHFQRPNLSAGLENYCQPLQLLAKDTSGLRCESRIRLREAELVCLLRALYSCEKSAIVTLMTTEVAEHLFAIWSQQWPSLRRSFSFRIIGAGYPSTPKYVFDLLVKSDSPPQSSDKMGADLVLEPWEQLTLSDLLSATNTTNTELRRFLWRYGPDLPSGTGDFQFLVKLFLSTRVDLLKGDELRQVLMQLGERFPSASDALAIKSDLVHASRYSLFPKIDPIATMDALFSLPPVKAFFQNPSDVVTSAFEHWESGQKKILSIAERAIENYSEVYGVLIREILARLDSKRFFSATNSLPKLRKALLRENPFYLDNDELSSYMNSLEILEYLSFIPENDPELSHRLLDRLWSVSNSEVPEFFYENFRGVTVKGILQAVSQGVPTGFAWHELLKRHAYDLLTNGFLDSLTSTSSMLALASIIEDVSTVYEVGPLPWARVINTCTDDIRGEKRHQLQVFFVVLSIRVPVGGCEPLFEYSFSDLHDALEYSGLHWGLVERLLPLLPNLGWFDNWDWCKRLRIAVTQTYIEGSLKNDSFLRLAKNDGLRYRLMETAATSKEGRRFLKRGH